MLRVSDAPRPGDGRGRSRDACASEGETGQAEELFQQVLARFPEHPRAHALLGVLLARTGRPAEAAYHLVSALFVEPEMGDAARVLLALASDPAIGSRPPEVNAALSGYAVRVGKDGEFAGRGRSAQRRWNGESVSIRKALSSQRSAVSKPRRDARRLRSGKPTADSYQ